jgi:hypothetical protein
VGIDEVSRNDEIRSEVRQDGIRQDRITQKGRSKDVERQRLATGNGKSRILLSGKKDTTPATERKFNICEFLARKDVAAKSRDFFRTVCDRVNMLFSNYYEKNHGTAKAFHGRHAQPQKFEQAQTDQLGTESCETAGNSNKIERLIESVILENCPKDMLDELEFEFNSLLDKLLDKKIANRLRRRKKNFKALMFAWIFALSTIDCMPPAKDDGPLLGLLDPTF